ncbi:MAG: TetR family transcriptional regulator [Betaproteobacteria bacterium]|jgi:AcrR family transcriptional regulator|nr:TetR family transcriptional regulator [Betaproteobacteria bacterium]
MSATHTAVRQRTRAVAPQDKSERRAAIMRAAEVLLHRKPLGEFSVEELAHRAGLAKGTVYLYFGTREEVLLAVHAERTQQLFDTIEKAVSARSVTGRGVARQVVAWLREHPEFLPLAAGCRAMLETNVGAQVAIDFKLGIGVRLSALGARLELAYPALPRGSGAALLMNCYALMLGLWQLADPPACLVDALDHPDLRVFRIDFERQLSQALVALWEGAAAPARSTAKKNKT